MATEHCYNYVELIYDFEKRQLNSNRFPKFASNGESQILRLAIYFLTAEGRTEMGTLNELMDSLVNEHFELVMNAIRYVLS